MVDQQGWLVGGFLLLKVERMMVAFWGSRLDAVDGRQVVKECDGGSIEAGFAAVETWGCCRYAHEQCDMTRCHDYLGGLDLVDLTPTGRWWMVGG